MPRTSKQRGTSSDVRLRRALGAWRRSLGPRHVSSDPALLREYQLATFDTDQRVRAVLRPGTLDQTARAIAVAARYDVSLYTISRGRNWGYGCRVPARDGCVILELSRLRKISALDDELGTVTVQAGVSFAELVAFLRKRRSKHCLSVTSGSPDGSVLANALERGIGRDVGAQRVETLCAMDVLLATGERINTGFGRFPRARARTVQRWGLGPSLDGLFSQSNFGVVTSATIWLQRRPRWAVVVQCSARPSALHRLVSVLRELVASGTLRGAIKLNNWFAKVMLADGDPRLFEVPGPDRSWFGTLLLSADDRDELVAKTKHVRARLERVSATVSVGRLENGRNLDTLTTPDASALRLLYFDREPPRSSNANPALDGRGALFLCPVVPLTATHLRRVTGLVERGWLGAGYRPYITLNLMDERAAQLVCGLFYDRRRPGEDRRALDAYEAVFDRCLRGGYYPYRLGVQSMGQLPPPEDAAVLARIKRALDPRGILSPGRYEHVE